jgi:hypothetical protein
LTIAKSGSPEPLVGSSINCSASLSFSPFLRPVVMW